MKNDREPVSIALFDLLSQAAYTFAAKSRKPRIWSNVPPGEQPAMFLFKAGENAAQDAVYGLTKWQLLYTVLIYSRVDTSPKGPTPETQLNEQLDAIEKVLQGKPPGSKQTLGGLVENAWIEGDVLMDLGLLDQQCALLIPVKVITGI